MAYISTEEVKAIRQTLKETFPQERFGCRRENYSSVHVTVKKSQLDWSNLFVDLEVSNRAGDDKYMLHLGSLEINEPNTYKLVREWMDQNPDSFENHILGEDRINIFFTDEQKEYIKELRIICETAPHKKGVGDLWFNKSDYMTDYFHLAWYIWIKLPQDLNPLLKEVATV